MKVVSIEWQYKFTTNSEKIILPDLEVITKKEVCCFPTRQTEVFKRRSLSLLYL